MTTTSGLADGTFDQTYNSVIGYGALLYDDAGTWAVTSTPEPTSLLLFGAGFLALAGILASRSE